MKKIYHLIAVAVLISSISPRIASALENQSFFNKATAGLFEETYDYFMQSPAYLPGFQKNAFWGQLSNLHDRTDQLVNNTATDNYLVGGENDIMGMGRGGLMFDWTSATTPLENNTRFDTTWDVVDNHFGYGEKENIRYMDRNGDGTMDYRRETYGQNDLTNNSSNADLYVAYGMGGIAGFDLGAGIYYSWSSNNPTYNSANSSFDRKGWERQYDLITNQDIYHYDTEATGKKEYGDSEIDVILGARSKELIPDLDFVANVIPVVIMRGNTYEYKRTDTYDYQANNIAVRNQIWEEKGVDSTRVDELPGTGMGVAVTARGDYQLNPGIKIIGEAGFGMDGVGFDTAKAKKDSTTTNNYTFQSGLPMVTVTDNQNSKTAQAWEGSDSNMTYGASARFQFPTEKFDFALGISYGGTYNKTQYTHSQETTLDARYQNSDGDNTNDYTQTDTIEKFKLKFVEETNETSIGLPVALVLKFLSNFSVQLGAIHTIKFSTHESNSQVIERTLQSGTRTYDNGVVEHPALIDSNYGEFFHNQDNTTSHSTDLTYGITWWPYEQVRIDFTGLTTVTSLSNYRFSINLYY